MPVSCAHVVVGDRSTAHVHWGLPIPPPTANGTLSLYDAVVPRSGEDLLDWLSRRPRHVSSDVVPRQGFGDSGILLRLQGFLHSFDLSPLGDWTGCVLRECDSSVLADSRRNDYDLPRARQHVILHGLGKSSAWKSGLRAINALTRAVSMRMAGARRMKLFRASEDTVLRISRHVFQRVRSSL